MKKYLVLRTNHGFQGRMWTEGAVVEFDDDVVPHPKNFKLMDGSKQAQAVVEVMEEQAKTLSEIQRKSLKPQPTAGEVLKKQKKVSVKSEDF